MDAFEILVVILSITLAIFLVIGIIFMSLFVELMKKLNRIADKAETAIDNVEAVSESIRKIASPLALFASIADKFGGFKK